MAYELNNKLSKLKPYDPIEGEYKIRLDANESYINLNDSLSDIISTEITKLDLNRYPDPYATKAVNAFADFYGIDNKFVTAGNGSDELISIITSCFLESGDKVVTLTPDFSMYAFYGSLYELEVLKFAKDNDTFETDCDKLIDYCKNNKAKMLIFSNPCNPTSIGIDRESILKIVKSLSCLVVIDEAYMDFWDQSILSEVKYYDNLIILKTCSKAIGLAGIRFGFAVAGETVTTALKAAKSPYNTDLVSQKLIEVAFSNPDILKANTQQIIVSTKAFYYSFVALANNYSCLEKIYKTSTNFIFIKTNKAKEIFTELLAQSIAVRCFDGYLRISTGTEEENATVLKKFEKIIRNY